MELLANETGGGVINLANLEELITSVESGVEQTLNSFELRIGNEQDYRDKFVYERSVVMEEKVFTNIRAEIYYD